MKEEAKIIDHINDRYGVVVNGPNVPLWYWERLEAASKLLWTGLLQRVPPIRGRVFWRYVTRSFTCIHVTGVHDEMPSSFYYYCWRPPFGVWE